MLQPPRHLEKINAQREIWTAAIRPLSVNCCGLGHRARTRDILLWLMTGDTCKICDLWRSCPCWSHTRRGISRGLIPAESCRNGHRRDSSLSHRPCCWELPWTAALCDTFFTGQLSASDRSHVLKCRQVWSKLKHSVTLCTAQRSVFYQRVSHKSNALLFLFIQHVLGLIFVVLALIPVGYNNVVLNCP